MSSKLGGLLDGKVRRTGTLEDPVHVGCRTPEQIGKARAVGEERSRLGEESLEGGGRQPMAPREVGNALALPEGEGVVQRYQRLWSLLGDRRERPLEVLRGPDVDRVQADAKDLGRSLQLLQQGRVQRGGRIPPPLGIAEFLEATEQHLLQAALRRDGLRHAVGWTRSENAHPVDSRRRLRPGDRRHPGREQADGAEKGPAIHQSFLESAASVAHSSPGIAAVWARRARPDSTIPRWCPR